MQCAYAVDEYGTPNGANSKYFQWIQNASGESVLSEVTDASNADLIFRFDGESLERVNNSDNISANTIEGNFIDIDYSKYPVTMGVAINNSGIIGDVNANFVGNNLSFYAVDTFGAVVYNTGEIGNINGNFIANYAYSQFGYVKGNTITNAGTINSINGDFIGNYASTDGAMAWGGAIRNLKNAYIGNIKGDFVGNYVSGYSGSFGGAIHNENGLFGDINSNFVNNASISEGDCARGGVIASYGGEIASITGDFTGNHAIANNNALGGAMHLSGTKIGSVSGNFIDNYAKDKSGTVAQGGAINAVGATEIGKLTGVFSGNSAESKTGDAFGGAIYNAGTIGKIDEQGNLVGGIVNSSFVNNYTKTDSKVSQGGAIYTTKDLNIIADNGSSLFRDNYTEQAGVKDQNAIYVASDAAALTLKSQNKGVIQFDDKIDGVSGYTLNITGDDKSKVILNNDVTNANVNLENTNLHLGKENLLDNNVSFSTKDANISFVNDEIGVMHVPSFSLKGSTNIAVDVNLEKGTMDTITADKYSFENDAYLNVDYLNLLNDALKDKTEISFADETLSGHVAYTGETPIAYSKIYKYDVSYNPENGFFTFVRGAYGGSGDFNPSVLPAPVATQAGAFTTQIQTVNYAFQHADSFMNIPYTERLAIKNAGKYALDTGSVSNGGVFSPLMTKEEQAGWWVKPYASFENVPLKNGPKVSNINYGTLIGYDTDMKPVSGGFDRVLTGYIGYNGSSQRYQGIDSYQNGGILGATITLYKGNFFNATTLSAGASAGNNTIMYGSENFALILAGIGNKTGYNFEFAQGRVILQPSFLISYTFVKTFDYTNAAGLRIESDPLNAIQLAPGIKLIGNTKNGWQPYIGVKMVWNLLDESKVTADDIRLPEMSIKPYVQYGIGLQKRIKDKFTAYGEAMIHNGGRNGVSLSAGLRWSVGKK